MQSLVSVFLLLTVTAFTGELLGSESEILKYIKVRECIDRLHMDNANLTVVVECLARFGSQRAYFEHTLWKIDLVQRRLQGLANIISDNPYVYVPSPYKKIDDVLKIKGSVAGYSCQQKLFVVQAIRRKLEQVYMMNGIESTLFKWPFKRKRPDIDIKQERTPNDYPELQDNGADYPELTCLIRLAIGNMSGQTP